MKTCIPDQRASEPEGLELNVALSNLKLRYDRRSRHIHGARLHVPERRRIRPVTARDRRSFDRVALSFPLEFAVLPWSKYRLLSPTCAAVPCAERNPQRQLAFAGSHAWHRPFLTMARFLSELLLVNGRRCWTNDGREESGAGLDLSEGGLRMTTRSSLWKGALIHLRIPSATLGHFGYTVLGKVVHVNCADPCETEAGVAFTALHPEDRHGLIRFLTSPLPQLAAMRRGDAVAR